MATSLPGSPGRTWSIVLAGGEGERLRPFVEGWLGRRIPKQYCAFVGTRSMLQHTIARADRLADPERRVTVIGRDHALHALPQMAHDPGRIVVQPANRDTAAGIFLPLAYVRRRDPGATVVILPSDHFVHPEERFVEAARSALRAAQRLPHHLVLVGAPALGPDPDYGWVSPGPPVLDLDGVAVRSLRRFHEKPSPPEARRAFVEGALWNTFVMAVQVETLWRLGRRAFPHLVALFEHLEPAIDRPEESAVLEAIYFDMPAANFSRDLLQRQPDSVALVTLEGARWSDWGRVERIEESLRLIGRRPAFADRDAPGLEGRGIQHDGGPGAEPRWAA